MSKRRDIRVPYCEPATIGLGLGADGRTDVRGLYCLRTSGSNRPGSGGIGAAVGRSITAAAERCGVNERTLRKWLAEPEDSDKLSGVVLTCPEPVRTTHRPFTGGLSGKLSWGEVGRHRGKA